MLATRGHV